MFAHFLFLPHKSVYSLLLLIKGIGPLTASRILASLGISPFTKYSDLSPSTIDQLNISLSFLRNLTSPTSSNYSSFPVIDFNFDHYSHSLLSHLLLLHSYRSSRLAAGFPARGQRTRSNARSSFRCRAVLF
jgi:ribosomal protein S13